MFVLVLHAALSGVKTSRALLVSQRWLFHCQVRSGSGCALLFSNLPDCHARRYVPGLRGASFRRRVLRCEHIAILQSAASSGLPSAIWRECRSASRCRFPRCENGSVFLRIPIQNRMLRSDLACHSWQTPRALGECIRKANALSLPTLRNLLTCSGMASQKGALQSRLPRWHCRICGSVSVLWHTGEVCATRKRFRIARSESAARRGQAELRAIPSLRIRCWRVDRFIPRRAAAPFSPATTQLHCSSAFRIC